MASRERSGTAKKAEPNKINFQAWVDRDVYFAFRDLLKSHKISMGEGATWAMRSRLVAAGVKVRADRGTRGEPTTRRMEESENAVAK
jgi:hypothetical protein